MENLFLFVILVVLCLLVLWRLYVLLTPWQSRYDLALDLCQHTKNPRFEAILVVRAGPKSEEAQWRERLSSRLSDIFFVVIFATIALFLAMSLFSQ